jgi:hypothetical protein
MTWQGSCAVYESSSGSGDSEVIHRWQVVGKIGESEFVAAPYTASGDGVYVRAADYDALAARLAEAERRIDMAIVALKTGMPEYSAHDVIDILTDSATADQQGADTEKAFCRNCCHDYEDHHRGPSSGNYCRHCPCPEYAAPDPKSAAGNPSSV